MPNRVARRSARVQSRGELGGGPLGQDLVHEIHCGFT